jgi:putative DNA primase/helicase
MSSYSDCPVEGWEDPVEIGSKLPEVSPFDSDILPESIRPMVTDVADRMQVPMDFPAVVAVATLAGVCGRRAVIQPKELDDSWIVVPNLWGAIVADVGMMKSPVIKAVTAAAQSVEKVWREEYEAQNRDYEKAKREWTLTCSHLDSEFKRQLKVSKKTAPLDTQKGTKVEPTLPELPSEPKAPGQKRLITTDATFESLHKLLEQNPGGIFVLRDELTGWLTSLEKIGRESERAFYLECWNGDSHFTLDRIGRGSIYVENCCVSLFGGIQPSRLEEYFANAIQDGFENDGLIQRFQLLVWPDKQKGWRYDDRRRDEAAFKQAESAYGWIANLDPLKPVHLGFSPEAQEYFKVWLESLMTVDMENDDLSAPLKSHFSKYRSLMPSLALLFSLSDSHVGPINLKYAEKAAKWCSFLKEHAIRAYGAQKDPVIKAAHGLTKKIKAGRLGDENGIFHLRDIYRNGGREIATPERARRVVGILMDFKWVRKYIDSKYYFLDPANGRPPEEYEINPQVLDRLKKGQTKDEPTSVS